MKRPGGEVGVLPTGHHRHRDWHLAPRARFFSLFLNFGVITAVIISHQHPRDWPRHQTPTHAAAPHAPSLPTRNRQSPLQTRPDPPTAASVASVTFLLFLAPLEVVQYRPGVGSRRWRRRLQQRWIDTGGRPEHEIRDPGAFPSLECFAAQVQPRRGRVPPPARPPMGPV